MTAAADILDRALGFIAKRGCARTDAIAAHLTAPADDVDRLLQPAIDSGYLCACRVMRPGKPDAFDYRISEAASGAAKPIPFASFTITHRPRAAAAPLQPQAAVRRASVSPAPTTEPVMSKAQITRQQVLAAIFAAGKGGISRRRLIDKFGVPEANIDMHVTVLMRQTPPVIYKPERGVICSVEYEYAPPATAEGAEEPLHDFPATDLAEKAPVQYPVLAVRAGDITLDDPDNTEFAIFSSGGLDIYAGDQTVVLHADVLAKLRRFLGLFQECA